MKKLQKFGGLAALYLALAYIVNIVIFLVILDYPSIVDPIQKMELIVNQQMVMFASNMIGYVIFGLFLIVFTLALYERLKSSSPALTKVAAVIGFIWAGSLIASGMVSNSGLAPTVALYATDPALAASNWSVIESVANGLSGVNGEILGGLLTVMVSWIALRAREFPKAVNYLGLLVGLLGVVTSIPGLYNLTGLFGVGQIIWFVWLGILMLRQKSNIVSAQS